MKQRSLNLRKNSDLFEVTGSLSEIIVKTFETINNSQYQLSVFYSWFISLFLMHAYAHVNEMSLGLA